MSGESDGRHSPRGAEPGEADPTGIRALLSSLPDPGPMPEDLVERISARLAAENAEVGGRAPDRPGHGSARVVVDLAAERPHRRPRRMVAILGVAAAGLLVTTVAVGQLAGGGVFGRPAMDSAAQVQTRSTAGDAGGAGGSEAQDLAGEDAADGGDDSAADGPEVGVADADEEAGAEALSDDSAGGAAPADGGEAGLFPDGLPGEPSVLPPLGDITGEDDYPERLQDVAAGPDAEAGAAAAPRLTADGARSCWDSASPSMAWDSLHAAEAELQGERVVVLMGLGADGAGETFVLPWSCTSGADVDPVEAQRWGS